MYVLVVLSFTRVQLFMTPWTVAPQAPLSIGIPRQEYWSGLPFPSSGDLPDPGIEPGSPELQADLYHLSHQGIPEQGWVEIFFSPEESLEGITSLGYSGAYEGGQSLPSGLSVDGSCRIC